VGDVHIPKPDPTKGEVVGAKVQELIDSGHQFYASAVTGNPSGRVRRATLFLIATVGVMLSAIGIQLGALAAIIAILLLALTDSVVEL
jgi:hypothetical protein